MSVKTIPTPIAEVADRYTIAKLKLERLPEEECPKAELQRQVDFYAEGLDHHDQILMTLVGELYRINGLMWDAEFAIRQGQDEGLGLDEIGRRALHIRDLNKERMAVKDEIVTHTGEGFKDCKMNSKTYARHDERCED